MGKRELGYGVKLSTADAIKKASELKAALKAIRDEAGKSLNIGKTSGLDTKPLTNFQQAQIALKKTIVDAQADSIRLKSENIALSNSYKAGQISAQAYSAQQKKIRADQRSLIESQKE